MSWKEITMRILAEDPEAMAEYERLRPRYEFLSAVLGARYKLGWTQRDLAEAVGVSQSVIGRLESGNHDPRFSTMVAVCQALGLQLKAGSNTMVAKRTPPKRRSA
ncbi:MAG: helix-turn-helix transcriptional regulator [Thermoleophilia bacterium]|nr:helix-turn-helix transcriptional regulator [Thermoleophilia bacterium]